MAKRKASKKDIENRSYVVIVERTSKHRWNYSLSYRVGKRAVLHDTDTKGYAKTKKAAVDKATAGLPRGKWASLYVGNLNDTKPKMTKAKLQSQEDVDGEPKPKGKKKMKRKAGVPDLSQYDLEEMVKAKVKVERAMDIRKQPKSTSVQKVLYWIDDRDQKLIEYRKQLTKRRKALVHAFLRFKGLIEFPLSAPDGSALGKIKATIRLDEERDELMVSVQFWPRKNVFPTNADGLIMARFKRSGLNEYLHNIGSGTFLMGPIIRDLDFWELEWKPEVKK